MKIEKLYSILLFSPLLIYFFSRVAADLFLFILVIYFLTLHFKLIIREILKDKLFQSYLLFFISISFINFINFLEGDLFFPFESFIRVLNYLKYVLYFIIFSIFFDNSCKNLYKINKFFLYFLILYSLYFFLKPLIVDRSLEFQLYKIKFFYGEEIFGNYVYVFSIYFLFKNYNFFSISLGLIILSGQRVLAIFSLIILSIILFIKKNLKVFLIILSFLILMNIKFYKSTYIIFFKYLKNFNESNYYNLFHTAYNIFLENKLSGIGIKNFRYYCEKKLEYVCSTHPHNYYFELLSEVGIIGFFLFSVFIILYAIKILKSYIQNKYITLLVFLLFFIPIQSSMSLTSSQSAFLICFFISIIYSVIKKSNELKI